MQTKYLSRLVVIVFYFLVTPISIASAELDCDGIELIGGFDDYNQNICSGLESFEKQDYGESIKFFERAHQQNLVDSPNFRMFPLLALSHFLNGDTNRAHEYLAKGKLAISVLIGELRCKEDGEKFYLEDILGRQYRQKYEIEIAELMCGAAYEYIYEYRSFERVLMEAKLIQRYLYVEKILNEKSQ